MILGWAAILVLHEIITEFGSSRDFILVGHAEFSSSNDLILMLVGKLCGIVQVLRRGLILIICRRSHFKPGRGILTVVVGLVLLSTIVVVEATAVSHVIGLVVYRYD